MDKLREKTDKELAKMEKKLGKIYEQAEKDIAEKWDEYMKAAAEKLEPLEKAYASAKESGDKDLIKETGKALGQEKYRQTIQNARFKDMLAETAEKISDVNAIALSYVNGEQAKVYSNNYNGTLKEIKSDIKGIATGVKFNMVDERTVRELVKKDKLLFSQKTLNRAKDRKWNLKALTSQVTQGILQGESVPNIAKRLAAVSDMNRTSCIRNARTMTTTSENSGRLAGMKEAEEKGIVYEKQWMATNDDRTRESHAELDGVSVPIDEPFPNGLMYPADMSGAPEEVYNCRCSMVRHLIGFRTEDGDVVDVGDIERYERRTPAAAKTETPTEVAENVKIEKEFFTPLNDHTYENPFPEAAKASDAELTRFIFNEKEFADVSEKTIKDATTVEKLELSELKSTQGSIDAENIKGMLDMSVKDLKELNEKEPPVVYKINGEYIIDDGNHRLSVLMAKGEETTMAKVIDVDKIKEAEKSKPSLDNVFEFEGKEKAIKDLEKMDAEEAKIWNGYIKDINYKKITEEESETAFFMAGTKDVNLFDYSTDNTFFHETAHAMDDGAIVGTVEIRGQRKMIGSDEWAETKPYIYEIKSASDAAQEIYQLNEHAWSEDNAAFMKWAGMKDEDDLKALIKSVREFETEHGEAAASVLGDMIDGHTIGKYPMSVFAGGHGKSYWENDASKITKEAWAEISSLKAQGNQKAIDAIAEILPNRTRSEETIYNIVFTGAPDYEHKISDKTNTRISEQIWRFKRKP